MARLHLFNFNELSVTQSPGVIYCLICPPIKPQLILDLKSQETATKGFLEILCFTNNR